MMPIYEHKRTQEIVSRLVTLGNSLRTVTVASWTVLLGVLLSFLAALIERDLWWLGGVLGILIGYLIGLSIATFFTVSVEWMAQLLVAGGEILAELKTKDEGRRTEG